MRWRLLLDRTSDPTINLATEEAIVRSRRDDLCQNTLRLWRSDKSVVLGCNSRVHDEVDVEACKRNDVRILRRTSGGSAVYHDLGNLNCSIVVKEERINPSSRIPDTYERLGKAILNGLTLLGVKAEFQKPNSVLLRGKKISGMAQHRFYSVILLHSTLLVNSDLQLLSNTLSNPKQEVTSISWEGSGFPSKVAIDEAIVAGFRRTFRMQFDIGTLTAYESRLAEELVTVKYGTERWNLDLNAELATESIDHMPELETVARCDS